MKLLVFLPLVLFLLFPAFSFAQEQNPTPLEKQNTNIQQPPKQDFFKAIVVEVIEQEEREFEGQKNYYQIIRIKITDGSEKNKFTIVENGKNMQIKKDQLVQKDDEIIVSKLSYPTGKSVYSIYDYYRLNTLVVFLIIFLLAVVLIGGLKGLGSITGMILSLGVLIVYIIPNILKGHDPLTITLIGSVVILLTTTYLAHGISKKTTIALISTLVSLFITAAFAIAAININRITGLGNEDFFALQVGPTSIIDIKGLFLSGIIISTLGALNDITTTQSATIYELKHANPKLTFNKLLSKGLNVGKEHIASLVNTLILAYVGSAFAVFIFLILNPNNFPIWVMLNNEIISDEIIRIIAGSVGLLLSVPIVTFIAAYVFSTIKLNEES